MTIPCFKFRAQWFTCTLQYSVECNVYLVYLYKLDRSTITPELTVIIQRKIYCSNFKNEEGGGGGGWATEEGKILQWRGECIN